MTIVEFLEARITEDEQGKTGLRVMGGEVRCPCGSMGVVIHGSPEKFRIRHRDKADHTILHPDRIRDVYEQCELSDDSKRWLAECVAKRELIELHVCHCPNPECRDCGECSGGHHADPTDFPCDTIKIQSRIYSDHPDFDQAWS